MNRGASGAGWEQFADDYLHEHGMRTLAANFRSRFGEIDRIMCDGETLVFVEVRYRGRGIGPRAVETVDTRKQQKLLRTAQFFLLRNPNWQRAPARFDVVAIDATSDGDVEVNWVRDAFRLS